MEIGRHSLNADLLFKFLGPAFCSHVLYIYCVLFPQFVRAKFPLILLLFSCTLYILRTILMSILLHMYIVAIYSDM